MSGGPAVAVDARTFCITLSSRSKRYKMTTHTASSIQEPCIALAQSKDLFHGIAGSCYLWSVSMHRRWWCGQQGCGLLPVAIPNPSGIRNSACSTVVFPARDRRKNSRPPGVP